jgi:hypothetical protein
MIPDSERDLMIWSERFLVNTSWAVKGVNDIAISTINFKKNNYGVQLESD